MNSLKALQLCITWKWEQWMYSSKRFCVANNIQFFAPVSFGGGKHDEDKLKYDCIYTPHPKWLSSTATTGNFTPICLFQQDDLEDKGGESAKDAQFDANKYGSHHISLKASENVAQTLFLRLLGSISPY